MSREVLGSADSGPQERAHQGGLPRPPLITSLDAPTDPPTRPTVDDDPAGDPTTAQPTAATTTEPGTDSGPRWSRLRLTAGGLVIALTSGLLGAVLTNWDARRLAESHPRATVMLWESGQPWSPDLSTVPLSLTVVNTGGAPFVVESGHVAAPAAAAEITVAEGSAMIRPGQTTVLSVRVDVDCGATEPLAADHTRPGADPGPEPADETIQLTVRSADGRSRTITAPEMPGQSATSGQFLGYLCVPSYDPFTAGQITLEPDGRLEIVVNAVSSDAAIVTATGPDGTHITLDPPQPVIEDGTARMRMDLTVTGCPASLLDRDSVGEVALNADDLQLSLTNYDPVLVTSWVTRKVVTECG